jgi:hypothetical protein
MAKRKKTRSVSRRKRVGAVGASSLSTFGGVAAGAIAARLVSSKLLSKLDPKIGAAITVAAGVFLTGQRNPMLRGVGLGMFGAGVISAGQSFNLLSGVPNRSSWLQMPDTDQMPVISGPSSFKNFLDDKHGIGFPSDSMPVINGMGNPQGDPSMNVIS